MCFPLLRYISYPRTETNIFPTNLSLGPLVEQQTQSPVWGAFAQRVMDQPGGPNPRQGKKSDQAHPPIHPTKHSSTLQVRRANVASFYLSEFLRSNSPPLLFLFFTTIQWKQYFKRFHGFLLFLLRPGQ